MNILILGEKTQTNELVQKLSLVSELELTVQHDINFYQTNLSNFDVIFDLTLHIKQDRLSYYADLTAKPIFVSGIHQQLAQLINQCNKPMQCCLIGFNALPTFINRNLAEVCVISNSDETRLAQIMQQLHWDYRLVSDRVGMVTPRIVCMIINEACYTLQEGTAQMKDIDTSMKLGTNYPFGPFEWADKIGVVNVYQMLESIYNDTKDERYKICSLLKTHYLKQLPFYA